MERGMGSGFPEPAQGCGGGQRGGSGPAAARGQPRPPQTALGAPGGAAATIHPQSRGFGTLFCGYFAGCCLHGALAHPFYSLCILFPLIPLAGVTVAVSTRKGFSLCWYSTARFVFYFFWAFFIPPWEMYFRLLLWEQSNPTSQKTDCVVNVSLLSRNLFRSHTYSKTKKIS